VVGKGLACNYEYARKLAFGNVGVLFNLLYMRLRCRAD